jgi:hypothetical protein
MAAILPFVPDGVFGPEDIKAMSTALNDVCKTLKLTDGIAKEVIAERIVALARRGERSATFLRDSVLQEAGLADTVDLEDGIVARAPSAQYGHPR